MNDRERILMYIINCLYFTQTVCLNGISESQFKDTSFDDFVHFGCYDDRPVQKGDLVLALTGNINNWKIAWVEEVISPTFCVLREIGSNRLCDYANEKFIRIVGMRPRTLLEMDEYIFDQKVLKAFQRGKEYSYRYGGVDFLGNKTARIWIREVFGGIRGNSQPFSFNMKWNKKTSIKYILEMMRENGYGTREFDTAEIKEEENE